MILRDGPNFLHQKQAYIECFADTYAHPNKKAKTKKRKSNYRKKTTKKET